jgi:hypothetical protein
MAGFQAGVATRDITPPAEWITAGRIFLWGYGDRNGPCTGVRDTLEVRVLAISDDEGATAILVAADLGALEPDTTERVRTRITDAHGIPGENICLNVSHTHTAPVFATTNWQPGVDKPDNGYVQLVEHAIVATVDDALSELSPALIEFGRGTTQIGYDRHPTGIPIDRTLDVVQATGADGTPIGVVFSAPCHPIARGEDNLISSDFVGPARAAVESGAGGVALFLQGYAGTCNAGVVPAEECGAQLGADVLTVLNGPMDALDGPLDTWLDTLDLPLEPIADGAVAAAFSSLFPEVVRWANLMTAEGTAVPDTLPTPVQTFRIGTGATAWYLVATAHEVSTDLPARMRGIWPYERLTVVSYSNAQLSYLPSHAVLATPPCTNFPFCRDNYEGGNAFVWYGHRGLLTPDAEDVFVEGHISLLDHGWEHIGHATDVVGLASWNGRLFAATSNGILWWRPPTPSDIPWNAMGHATSVVGLAACDGSLFAATNDGRLWQRTPYGNNISWTPIGHATSVVAMTALDGRLFAATGNDKLWRRDPIAADIPWEDMGHAQMIVGLAATRDKLFAATSDGNLHWREPFGFDLPWHRYGTAQLVVGMAAIDDLLFVATSDGKLWRRAI